MELITAGLLRLLPVLKTLLIERFLVVRIVRMFENNLIDLKKQKTLENYFS